MALIAMGTDRYRSILKGYMLRIVDSLRQMPINAESYFQASDWTDGKSDGKSDGNNAAGRKNWYRQQRLASTDDDRLGIASRSRLGLLP